MLNQFFADWNTAIQSRTIVNETRNPDGVITMQETKFKFRDVEITMFSRILPGGENLPPEKRRWASEMFVPSTNKIIPSVRYNSKAKCAIEILTALVPGRAHEDKVEARVQNRKKNYLQKLYNERMARLADTSFTKDQQHFIVMWMQDHVIPGRAFWDDAIIDILCKYHAYVTGIGLSDWGINLGNEADLHIGRMYNTACLLLSESFHDRFGLDALNRGSMSHHFLSPRQNIKYGMYVVRSGYSKIFDECKLSTKFMHFVNLVAALYAMTTGEPVEKRLADVKAFRERMRERRHERGFNGETKRRNTNSQNRNISAFSNHMAPISSTIGEAFGDVLDQVKTDDDSVEQFVQQKPVKKKKFKVPVTNGQINGKILETGKESETTEVENEQLPPVPEEIVIPEEESITLPAEE